eukprot:661738-Hanusia_phi.AAC.1
MANTGQARRKLPLVFRVVASHGQIKIAYGKSLDIRYLSKETMCGKDRFSLREITTRGLACWKK